MTIQDVYTQYQIMPQLSLHMRRVAGVGQLVLNGWQGDIDRELVMRTLLLHDMGNIVKFDLQNLLMPVENVDHWRRVQQAWWEKYGKNTHEVTLAVVRELGQADVLDVLSQEHAGYVSGDTSQILKQGWPAKILAYCDVRVTPQGVVPMRERIADLQARYGRELSWYDFLYALEENIRTKTTTSLDQINEASVKPFFGELLNYPL